jgi:3-methylcrotonyl-CoA carboxylase alpha subunit
MMMKVIAHGEDRNVALVRLRTALVQLAIAGIRTNRDFICHVLDHDRFREGGIGTNHLDEHLPEIFGEPGPEKFSANVCAAALALATGSRTSSPWSTHSNFRLNSPHRSTILLEHSGDEYEITLEHLSGTWMIVLNGRSHRCTSTRNAQQLELVCDGTPYSFDVLEYGDHLTLVSHSRTLEFLIPMEQAGQSEEEGTITAPLAGKIAAILVSEGDAITKGTPIAIIEAMKMEHTVSAPSDGIVKCVNFSTGDLIDEGVEILELEVEEDT